jgi:hypothetical protein
MFAKKGPERATSGAPTSEASLDRLYQRRLAIETLIESLEEYGQYRSKRLDVRKRKIA